MWPAQEFERWSRSGRYSTVVEVPKTGGRLISLKVPLPSRYEHLVDESSVFSTEMFVQRLAAKKTRISLVIEAVPKVFRGQDWDDFDISVCRLPGETDVARDSTPSHDDLRRAVDELEALWRRDPRALVAVVSVDGYNTAGAIIVAALANHLPLREAVDLFARARPPGIFSPGHLRMLAARYDDDSSSLFSTTTPPQHFADLPADTVELERRTRRLEVVAPDTGRSVLLCALTTSSGTVLPDLFQSNQTYEKNLAEIATFRSIVFEVGEANQKKLEDFLGYLRARNKAAVVATHWYLEPQTLLKSSLEDKTTTLTLRVKKE